jgi:Ca2+-binding RTX toxin-like protein
MHLGDCLLAGDRHGLLVDGPVAKRRDDGIRAAPGDVAQRLVGLAITGTDTMSGSTGSDTINVQDGAGGDSANGGLGSDTCTTDPGDTTNSC